ncbi:MAG: hypothetical protein FWD52_03110 [Candidatus Bathyarchaeota archaeon]|nr:hypothetical protein [Candidatus Termiticorpusculum sp.]
MATSLDKSIELDFAEFTSTLISETLSAIITSTLTQEKQAAQLEQQLALSPEEYAKENLTKEHIETEIAQLFPPTTNGKKSSIEIGEPYTLNEETGETPAINKKIGYTITREDISEVKRSDNQIQKVINPTGYNHIYEATKKTISTQQLELIKQIVTRGIPRVYINDGHIKTKLLLRLENQTPTNTNNNSNNINATTKANILNKLRRLVVQPVNATKPEFLTLNADILSEIEITFKVITP